MTGLTQLAHPDSVLEVFDWASLPVGGIVVDVGGGIGTQMAVLARILEHLKLVVQDREAVCTDALKHTTDALPAAIETGQIQIQAHDIFTPQPVKDAAVFYLRHIIHDWPDSMAVTILKQLREAAQPHTRLVVHDLVMQYACADVGEDTAEHEVRMIPPEPLLANWGRANSEMYNMDMQMMVAHYAQERTLEQFRTLLSRSGWKIDKVSYGSRPMVIANHSIIAIPVTFE